MFELRPYQSAAIETCRERIAEGHRPIICAPTGSGKTVIAAQMAKDYMDAGLRVLFMSGRREILRQSYETFVGFCGVKNVGFLMAGEGPWWFYPPVTIASWDTLKARWGKSDVWHVPADVVFYDECHLALSPKMCKTVIPFYKEAINIGLSATPAKQSGKGLGTHFTRIIQVQSVQQIIDDGYLAECEYWAGSYADVSKVKTVNGDYENKGLSAAAKDNVLIGDVIENWLKIASDRHTIVFAVDIAHAEALTKRFQEAGIAAEVLHSKTPLESRNIISKRFKSQDTQVLVNVGIATYGYDVPSVNCVVLARPTKSIVLHLQCIGRGMRPKPDGGFCKVLDHADNVRRLGAAEDPVRWRLDSSKPAATNFKRHKDEQQGTKEAEIFACKQCAYMFSRSRVCPKCGWEKPLNGRDVAAVEADLVKVRKAKDGQKNGWPTDEDFFRMLRHYAQRKHYSSGWAAYKYRDRLGDWPPDAWKRGPIVAPIPLVNNWIQMKEIQYHKGKKKREQQRASA